MVQGEITPNNTQILMRLKNYVNKFCGQISGREGGVLLSPRVRPNNYGFRGKMCGGHDTAIFTMLYLILLTQ